MKFFAAVLIAGLLVSITRAQTAVVPAPLQSLTKAWADTINAGNLEGWLNLHATDVDYADYTYWVGKSRTEMRRWGAAIINANGRFTITSSRMQGDTLIWLLEYRDSGFANRSQALITVNNGLISKLVIGSRP